VLFCISNGYKNEEIMSRLAHTSRIVGTGITRMRKRSDKTASELMQDALQTALSRAALRLRDLDGLIAVPSLSHTHFLEAHHFVSFDACAHLTLCPAVDV